MKEDLFFKVGYTPYLPKEVKKNNWTSRFFKKIAKHKLMCSIAFVIVFGMIFNFYMIYQFISILERTV